MTALVTGFSDEFVVSCLSLRSGNSVGVRRFAHHVTHSAATAAITAAAIMVNQTLRCPGLGIGVRKAIEGASAAFGALGAEMAPAAAPLSGAPCKRSRSARISAAV